MHAPVTASKFFFLALFCRSFETSLSTDVTGETGDGWSSSRPVSSAEREPSLSSSSSGDDLGILSPSDFAHRSLAPTTATFVKSLKTRCDEGNLEIRVEVPNPFGGKIYARGYTGKPMCHGRRAQSHASTPVTKRRQRAALGDMSGRKLDSRPSKLVPLSTTKSEKLMDDERSRDSVDDTNVLVLTAPVDECGVKTTRIGAEDEYELYLYVQFDPHVQQVVDEQLLIKCSPTFGSGPMRETIVVSKALGSGSNDVSTTAFVGTGSGEKDDMLVTESFKRGGASSRSGLLPATDDEPRVPGTVVDDVVDRKTATGTKNPAIPEDAAGVRNREPHSHPPRLPHQHKNLLAAANTLHRHRNNQQQREQPPAIQKATSSPPPSATTKKRIVVLDDFARNRTKPPTLTSKKHRPEVHHPVGDHQSSRREDTSEDLLSAPDGRSPVLRESQKFSADDSPLEAVYRPKPAATPTLKPSIVQPASAAAPKPTEALFGWMEVADSASNNILGEPEALRVGQEATIQIKVRHRAGLVVRVVDCIAHDGSNPMLVDPTSSASTPTFVGSNQQRLIDRNGCPVDSSIMPDGFQEIQSNRRRRNVGTEVTSVRAGKTKRTPHVPTTTVPIRSRGQKQLGSTQTRMNFEESRFYSTFKAFKFADNDEVHFKCTVLLCQNYCPLRSCRKRRNMSIGASSYPREFSEDDHETYGSQSAESPEAESQPKTARYTDDSSSPTNVIVPELLGAKEEKNSGQILASAVVFDAVSVRTPNLAEALREAMTKPSSAESPNRSSFRRRDDQPVIPDTSKRPAIGRTASPPALTSGVPAEVESMSLEEQHLFCVTPSKIMLAFGVLLALLLVSVLAAATFCIRSRRYDQLVAARFAGMGGAPLMPRPTSAAAGMGRPPSAIPTPPYAHVIKPGSPYFRVMR